MFPFGCVKRVGEKAIACSDAFRNPTSWMWNLVMSLDSQLKTANAEKKPGLRAGPGGVLRGGAKQAPEQAVQAIQNSESKAGTSTLFLVPQMAQKKRGKDSLHNCSGAWKTSAFPSSSGNATAGPRGKKNELGRGVPKFLPTSLNIVFFSQPINKWNESLVFLCLLAYLFFPLWAI